MAAAAEPPAPSKPEKKQHQKDKKRAREEDAEADAGRKLKKSKSFAANLELDAVAASPDQSKEHKSKGKKEKRHKSTSGAGEDGPDRVAVADVAAVTKEEKEKKRKKKKKRDKEKHADRDGDVAAAENGTPQKQPRKKKAKDGAAPDKGPAAEESSDQKKSKKSKKHAEDTASAAAAERLHNAAVLSPLDPEAMDVDPTELTPSASSVYQPPDMPASPQFPFFTQTVSLYEPIYPNGWAQPVTSAKYQHLQHLQNKYVPALRGVLLDYHNIVLGPAPGRGDGAADNDDAPTTVMSRGEYAVGFGWITADVELFVPSRGAWMEGSVNLQTEGHIGVVCFGRFNASIEARRLPPAWKWVSNESSGAQGFEETASVISADDHGVVHQIHSTGFWVDGMGARVAGKMRFRIRNFDAGTSGDTTYLSLEGTMLDMDSERRLAKEEAHAAQARRPGRGGQRIVRPRAPDFSMTRFAAEEAEEGQGQAKDLGSEAGAEAEPGPEMPLGGETEQGLASEAGIEE